MSYIVEDLKYVDSVWAMAQTPQYTNAYEFYVKVDLLDQSSETNKSHIKVYYTLKARRDFWDDTGCTGRIYINGSQVATGTISKITYQMGTVTVVSYEGYIDHNSSGVGSFTVNARFEKGNNTHCPDTNNHYSSAKTVNLPTIPLNDLVNVRVGGTWKQGKAFVKVGGAWKEGKKVYVKVNGEWKESAIRG